MDYLSDNNKLEMEKILLHMKKEINTLNFQICHENLYKTKINILKNTKIMLKIFKRITPLILSLSLIFGMFSYYGEVPFFRDYVKKKLYKHSEYDSNDNKYRYEEQYGMFDNVTNTLSYVSKWQLENDGSYSRQIQSYGLDDIISYLESELLTVDFDVIDENNIDEFFEVISSIPIQKLLDNPMTSKTERRKVISDSELVMDSFFRISIYSYDNNDFLMVKQSSLDNAIGTSLWGLFSLLFCISDIVLMNKSNSKLKDQIKKIKDSYSAEDLDFLKKKLELLQSNYKILTR